MLEILSAGVIAAVVVLILGPVAIPLLHRLKFGQSIRTEGPASHQKKSGTPTMGGIFMIAAIVIATLIRAELTTEILLALFILIGHFVLGFLDDYIFGVAGVAKTFGTNNNRRCDNFHSDERIRHSHKLMDSACKYEYRFRRALLRAGFAGNSGRVERGKFD